MKLTGGIVAAGMAVVVLAASALVVVAAGGDGSGTASGKDDTVAPEPEQTEGPAPEEPEEPSGPDPLCVANDERTAAVAAVTPADSPERLQTYVSAQLAFYAGGAEREAEPDAGAFRSMAGYFEATRAFYESIGWGTPDTLDEISSIPQLPADGSATRTAEILSERCGITVVTDRPATP